MPNSDQQAAGEDSAGRDVVVVPLRDGTVWTQSWAEVLKAAEQYVLPVSEAIARLLSQPRATGPQRLYAIRPEDEKALQRFNTVEAGQGWFRAFLWDDDKKFVHQMALREVTDEVDVQATPAVDPTSLVFAAQMAAIRLQLDRIEETLERIESNSRHVIEILERESNAETVAAVATIRQVHGTLERTGLLTNADWSRVSHLEQVVVRRHTAVVAEIEAFAGRLDFNSDLSHDSRIVSELDADRWKLLLTQEALLSEAGSQWVILYATALLSEGSADVDSLYGCRERHAMLSARASAAEERARRALSATDPRVRTWVKLLLTPKGTGMIGRREDKERLARVVDFKNATAKAISEYGVLDHDALPVLELSRPDGTARIAPKARGSMPEPKPE